MKDNRKQRTEKQNNSLHLFCELLAKSLNDSGWEMKKFLSSKPEIEIPWTKESVKEVIWRPVQRAMTGEESTTQMNTVDPSEIWEVINRHIINLTDGQVCVLWPSEETRDEY